MSKPQFSLEKIRLTLPNTLTPTPEINTRLPRHGVGELFLKGPIPLTWLTKAAALRGRTLEVSIILWWKAGMNKKRSVRFKLCAAMEMGVSREAARRALKNLSAAMLISIEQKAGRVAVVTINDVPGTSPSK